MSLVEWVLTGIVVLQSMALMHLYWSKPDWTDVRRHVSEMRKRVHAYVDGQDKRVMEYVIRESAASAYTAVRRQEWRDGYTPPRQALAITGEIARVDGDQTIELTKYLPRHWKGAEGQRIETTS